MIWISTKKNIYYRDAWRGSLRLRGVTGTGSSAASLLRMPACWAGCRASLCGRKHEKNIKYSTTKIFDRKFNIRTKLRKFIINIVNTWSTPQRSWRLCRGTCLRSSCWRGRRSPGSCPGNSCSSRHGSAPPQKSSKDLAAEWKEKKIMTVNTP